MSSVGVCVCMCVNVFLRSFVRISLVRSFVDLFICLLTAAGRCTYNNTYTCLQLALFVCLLLFVFKCLTCLKYQLLDNMNRWMDVCVCVSVSDVIRFRHTGKLEAGEEDGACISNIHIYVYGFTFIKMHSLHIQLYPIHTPHS